MSSLIAIDASLTGLAVVSFTEPDLIDYDEFTSKPAKTLEGRINRYITLANKVLAFINKTNPDLILIEGYAFSARGASVVTMGEFGGVLRYHILKHGAKVIEVPPTTLKKFVTGKGNASKLEVVSKLSSKYQVEFFTDNHADAYGLMMLGKCVMGLSNPSTKIENEVVELVKKSL